MRLLSVMYSIIMVPNVRSVVVVRIPRLGEEKFGEEEVGEKEQDVSEATDAPNPAKKKVIFVKRKTLKKQPSPPS